MRRRNVPSVWVLNILNTESDETRPITQTEIASIISEVYHCDRKTVCRNIKFLKEMGYPIIKTSKGFYIKGKSFTADELHFIQNAILNASEKVTEEKRALAEKVMDILSKSQKRK